MERVINRGIKYLVYGVTLLMTALLGHFFAQKKADFTLNNSEEASEKYDFVLVNKANAGTTTYVPSGGDGDDSGCSSPDDAW